MRLGLEVNISQCPNPLRHLPIAGVLHLPLKSVDIRVDIYRDSITILRYLGFSGCIISNDSFTYTHLRCQFWCIEQYLNEKRFLWYRLTCFVSTL